MIRNLESTTAQGSSNRESVGGIVELTTSNSWAGVKIMFETVDEEVEKTPGGSSGVPFVCHGGAVDGRFCRTTIVCCGPRMTTVGRAAEFTSKATLFSAELPHRSHPSTHE